jgi:hypothetical protein
VYTLSVHQALFYQKKEEEYDEREDIPRECTELRVLIYWDSFRRVPDLGTWEIFTHHTDVGTLSDTGVSMFTV